jgi:AraC-like DNA-binding protein
MKIVSYLEWNIGEKLTLANVSARFGLSERSMSRLFKADMDISFLQYLKTLRIIKAIELLLNTDKPINEIADDVGYSSISAFSDTFSEFTQSRPSDLRKAVKRLKIPIYNLHQNKRVFYLLLKISSYICPVKIIKMFSKTCEYALRALIYIAQQSKNDSRVGIKDISKSINSPEHFIAKILQDLSRKGFVQSVKGPNGGFYMDQKI